MHSTIPTCSTYRTLIKKKIKFFSYTRKFRGERLQSWLTAPSNMTIICAFPHILGSPSSYSVWLCNRSRLNFFIYEEENFIFILYQCTLAALYLLCNLLSILVPFFLSPLPSTLYECRILIQKCLKLVQKNSLTTYPSISIHGARAPPLISARVDTKYFIRQFLKTILWTNKMFRILQSWFCILCISTSDIYDMQSL